MSDNVGITQGSGTNIATDDVEGIHYQRVKQCFGADGSATDVSDANPFPSKLHKITVPSGTPGRNVSVTNGTVLKNGPTKLLSIFVCNAATTMRFLKLYDLNSNPNPASNTPVQVYGIPAGCSGPIPIDIRGLSFANGLAALCTSTAPDNSVAYAGTNEMIISWSAE